MKLYKYTTIDTALKIMKDERILLNNPKYYNDLFDCSFIVNDSKDKAIHEKIKDKSKYLDWHNRADIKTEMHVDIILLLTQFGYSPTPPEVYEKVYADIIAQAENFKKCED